MPFCANPSISHSFLIDELNRCIYDLWMDPLFLFVTQCDVLKKMNYIRWTEKKKKCVRMVESWLLSSNLPKIDSSAALATASIKTTAATMTF